MILNTPHLTGFAIVSNPGYSTIYAPVTVIGFDTGAGCFVVKVDDLAGQRHGLADEIDNLATARNYISKHKPEFTEAARAAIEAADVKPGVYTAVDPGRLAVLTCDVSANE